MQSARAYQATSEFRDNIIHRQVAEHRIGRLMQLGMRQSRYFGRIKTRFQLLVKAAVANLTLVQAWVKGSGAGNGLDDKVSKAIKGIERILYRVKTKFTMIFRDLREKVPARDSGSNLALIIGGSRPGF